jgi:hypothetical protein
MATFELGISDVDSEKSKIGRDVKSIMGRFESGGGGGQWD